VPEACGTQADRSDADTRKIAEARDFNGSIHRKDRPR
jgi:hypothetical protein